MAFLRLSRRPRADVVGIFAVALSCMTLLPACGPSGDAGDDSETSGTANHGAETHAGASESTGAPNQEGPGPCDYGTCGSSLTIALPQASGPFVVELRAESWAEPVVVTCPSETLTGAEADNLRLYCHPNAPADPDYGFELTGEYGYSFPATLTVVVDGEAQAVTPDYEDIYCGYCHRGEATAMGSGCQPSVGGDCSEAPCCGGLLCCPGDGASTCSDSASCDS